MQDLDTDRMVTFRRELHRHPELSGEERETARRISAMLREIGVDEIHEQVGGHGVVAIIEGQRPGASVGLRADIDALPLQEVASAGHCSSRANVMHACGHDGHTAMLMGAAARLVRERPERGRVVLVFQPAEELGTGAPGDDRQWAARPFPASSHLRAAQLARCRGGKVRHPRRSPHGLER